MTRLGKPYWMLLAAVVAAIAGATTVVFAADGGQADATPALKPELKQQYEAMRSQLEHSPFGRPLVLQSGASASRPRGDVYALVDHPFATVEAALRHSANWCDIVMLQTNVKRCVPSDAALRVAITRKSEQSAADGYEVDFKYALQKADADLLRVRMTAADGPLGTSDYQLALEAVPVDAGHTFIHMSYSYATGMAARLATDAYLSTTGRDKVGFSIVGKDASGAPRYVDGMRGVAERNTMRYYVGIEALLGALSAPPQQQAEHRLQAWVAAAERYPRQLKEMAPQQYLAMKRREVEVGTASTAAEKL